MSSLLSSAERVPEDAAFGIIRLAKVDKHPNAVMLSAGVYRDEDGQPWTLPVVAKAKSELHKDNELSHDYLPIAGDPLFLKGARSIVLGPKHFQDPCIASVQTVAGTGANHIGALLLTSVVKPRQVWFSDPTWVNHPLIWEKAGKQVKQRTYPYFEASTNTFNFNGMVACLDANSLPGDVVVLQSCAHNPTGIDPSKEQWRAIAELCQRRQLFPFFDSAYLGFASGDLEEDSWAVRYFLDRGDVELCIAQSFSKNFGLYSERVGALHFKAKDTSIASCIQSLLEQILRSEISTPPAFGARLVAKVLNSDDLFQQWLEDLQSMSSRIQNMRKALYTDLVNLKTPGFWEHILHQNGMFSYIGITPDQAVLLKDDYHVYLLSTGRVSMTGITKQNVGYIAASIDSVVRRTTIGRNDD